MPLLSVIVPVYNTAQYLKLCIDSILTQSFNDFELILTDNHSTDGSTDILKEYAAKDARVKYIQPESFVKASVNRQVGLETATGEFITYVDSDDSIKPGMYEHLFREQKKYGGDIVVCNYDLTYPDKVTPSYSAMKDEVINIKEVGYPYYFSKYFCMPKPNNYLWSRIIRRKLALDHNVKFPPVDISEDTIFTMLCTAWAKTVVHTSPSYYNYFQREDSTTRETIRATNIADSYVYAFECVDAYVKANGLSKVFEEIMPLYAATRVRSILFYIKQATGGEVDAFNSLAIALKDSKMPEYLRQAAAQNKIKDEELANTVRQALEVL